jgi:hypothetical protein
MFAVPDHVPVTSRAVVSCARPTQAAATKITKRENRFIIKDILDLLPQR